MYPRGVKFRLLIEYHALHIDKTGGKREIQSNLH